MSPSDLAGWRSEVLDIPFPGKNHDAWAISATAVAVVDGATPLAATWPQDLKRFSQRIADVLVGSGAELPMPVIWERSIELLRGEFEPAGHRRSAGVAFARQVGDALEFAALGDVKCLIRLDDSTVELIDTRLIELDRIAAVAGTVDALLENRALANKPDGYPIFADDPRASERLTMFTVELDRVRSFALLSDGGWRCLSPDPSAALGSILTPSLAEAFAATVENRGARLTDDSTIVRLTSEPLVDCAGPSIRPGRTP